MDIFRQQFGVRLRAARKRIPGLTQEKLAEIVDVEGPSVSRWETGHDFPEDFRLPAICKAVGVKPEYFTRPEQVIHQDPLPDWAAAMERRMELLVEKHEARLKTDADYRSLNNIAEARLKKIEDLEAIMSSVPKVIWQSWSAMGSLGRAFSLYLVGDTSGFEKLPSAQKDKLRPLLKAIGSRARTK